LDISGLRRSCTAVHRAPSQIIIRAEFLSFGRRRDIIYSDETAKLIL
jgi:hypothetical protein